MARAGLLHVTVMAATLLRDAGGSNNEPAGTYASVGCGSQNFTTNIVKNRRAKPSWNESHTFKVEERNELETQHILIEIFAEKPKLDELLGLAKIPLQKVIIAGDEISTHSLNRPDEEYIGHEQYSGHVKVALRWDSPQQSSAPAYPQTYTPAARYNPHASTAKTPDLARQTIRSSEQLQTSKSGEELHHAEDIYGAGQDRRFHHRSSSYPSRSYSVGSSSPSHSQSPWKQVDESSTAEQFLSDVHPPGAHSSFEAQPNAPSQQEQGSWLSPHVPYAGPHVPYVPHKGNKAGNGTSGHGRAAHATPTESGLVNADPKLQDEKFVKLKLSKSKQVEMAKLAELSRLTESAKSQATGFAKAGQQPSQWLKQTLVHPQQQQQQQVSTRPKSNDVRVQQPHQVPRRPKKDDARSQWRLTNSPPRSDAHLKQLTVVPTMLDIIQAQPQKSHRDEKPGQLRTTSQCPADVIYEKAILKAEKSDLKKKVSPFRQTLKILRKTSKIFGI